MVSTKQLAYVLHQHEKKCNLSVINRYAIRYAIQLDKRMTLKCGQVVMLIGWIISIILATLPLAGINSYQKTGICLPMDVDNFSGM